tara:strand:+ start:155 stop:460 length:306 start_codon:yes stop_codon:yes gene_type:complete
MTEFEAATLNQNLWLIILTGSALLANAFALIITAINLKRTSEQVGIQQGVLEQQIIATEISLIVSEMSSVDVRGGIDSQRRLESLRSRLDEAKARLAVIGE